MAALIWPDSKNISNEEDLIKFLVKKSRETDISPLYLNVGLWLGHAKASVAMEMLFEKSQ